MQLQNWNPGNLGTVIKHCYIQHSSIDAPYSSCRPVALRQILVDILVLHVNPAFPVELPTCIYSMETYIIQYFLLKTCKLVSIYIYDIQPFTQYIQIYRVTWQPAVSVRMLWPKGNSCCPFGWRCLWNNLLSLLSVKLRSPHTPCQ